MAKTCEHNLYEPSARCRKRARVAILYRYIWAHRMTGTGQVAEYAQNVAYRCLDHEHETPGERVKSALLTAR